MELVLINVQQDSTKEIMGSGAINANTDVLIATKQDVLHAKLAYS